MDQRMNDCDGALGELVPYHFGTTSDDARDRIDAHLVACTSCLKAYLRLKRHAEGGTTLARPSDEVRRRIRADVAAVVRPRGSARLARILRRPVPLYQTLAVAAAVAVGFVGFPALRAASVRHESRTEARVDTSRPVAESLSVY